MSHLDTSSAGHIQPLNPRVQALCLSGGGYRGLYSARVLEHLQSLTALPLHTHFRFIAGTSIGAVIAAALAAGVKASRIREAIESMGPRLFERGWFHSGRRLLFSAPYKQELLSNTLIQLFNEIGEHTLLSQPIAKTNLPLVVVATSASTHEPRIYGGNRLPLDLDCHPDISLLDAILASAAAPTYFPAKLASGENLVDGGLIANAPDLVALGILQRRLGVHLAHCHVLSIGTCAPTFAKSPAAPDQAGQIRWIMRKRNLVDLTLDAQQKLTVQLMRQLLQERFVRIDTRVSGHEASLLSSLDTANAKTTELLMRLADEQFHTLAGDPQVRAYFST